MYDIIKDIFKSNRADKELAKKYKEVFGTAAGKEVLDNLLQFTQINQPTFRNDPYQTAFNEGMRRVGLRLISMLESDPESLLKDKILKKGK
jgi:hypothetical protein